MSNVPPKLVLITGANGFIGYATTVAALRQGYHVRAAVRRHDAIKFLLDRGSSIGPYYQSGALEFVVVPDMTILDAFVAASKNCSSIIHIANPLGNQAGDLTKITCAGVEAILYAAEQNISIRRVVWTGAGVGNAIPFEQWAKPDHPVNLRVAREDPSVPPVTPDVQPPWTVPEDAELPSLARYALGKIRARELLTRRAESMSDNKDARFDIIVLIPGWTLGPNELIKTREEAFDPAHETNAMLRTVFKGSSYRLNDALGNPEDEKDAAMIATTVHIDDVSAAHVAALNVEISGNIRSYLLFSDGPSGPVVSDAVRYVREAHPSLENVLASEDDMLSMRSGRMVIRDRKTDKLQKRYE